MVARIKPDGVIRDLALFIAVALGVTWPLVLHLNGMAVGALEWNGRLVYFEAPTNIWNIWWFRYSLLSLHQSPFDCGHLLYPVGANLWFHTLAPTLMVSAAILQQFLSLTATYNVLLLAGLVASALAAAALAREFGLARAGSNLAGAIYAFSPAVMGHLYAGHLELVWTCWMPLGLLVFLRLLRRSDHPIRRGLALGAVLACAAYSSAYYFLYTAGVLLVAAAANVRRFRDSRVGKSLALTAALTAIALAPPVMNFWQAGSTLSDRRDTERSMRELSIDPVALVIPSFLHPWLATPFQATQLRMNRGIAAPPETTGFVGITCLALVALFMACSIRSALVRRRYDWPLAAAIAIVFLVLSFGTELKFNGAYRGVTLPAAWLVDVPIVRLARAPGRQIIIATLGIGLLAAMGWEMLATKWLRALVLLLLAVEFLPAPLPLLPIRLPDVYRRLAGEPGAFAVLDVPLSVRDGNRVLGRWNGLQMLGQTVHGHPIVGGVISRISDSRWQQLTSEPVIGQLLDSRAPTQDGAALSFFRRQGILAFVMHPEATPEERQLISSTLPIESRERFPDGFELWWLR